MNRTKRISWRASLATADSRRRHAEARCCKLEAEVQRLKGQILMLQVRLDAGNGAINKLRLLASDPFPHATNFCPCVPNYE